MEFMTAQSMLEQLRTRQTLAQLAEALDCSVSQVSRIERGHHEPLYPLGRQIEHLYKKELARRRRRATAARKIKVKNL